MTAAKIPPVTHDGMQRCPRCDRWKPLAEFKPSAHGRSGQPCRRCDSDRRREARESNGWDYERSKWMAHKILRERHADEFAEILRSVRAEDRAAS